MSLDATVRAHVGALDLDVDLQTDHETVAVLGPNGAGKTTLLRAIAGFVPLDAGHVVIDATVVEDAGAGVYVVPERRSIGMVFQDYLLFPHLSVLENVAFGLRSRHTSRRDARASAGEWVDRVGLGDRGRAKPRELSGGQQQRVALARALAIGPRVLLLDEPLAALDVAIRTELRRDLRALLGSFGGTRILVTHELLDAVALADRLVILEHGRIAQEGTVEDVCAAPRSRYVADLVGVNLLEGVARERQVTLSHGGSVITAEPKHGPVYVAIPPQAVSVHRRPPEGSPRNVWPGRISGTDPLGDRVRVHIDGSVPLVAEITTAAVRELGLREAAEVWAAVKATEVSVYAR